MKLRNFSHYRTGVLHSMIDRNILALQVEHLVQIGNSKGVSTDEDCAKRYSNAGHTITRKYCQEEGKVNAVLYVI